MDIDLLQALVRSKSNLAFGLNGCESRNPNDLRSSSFSGDGFVSKNFPTYPERNIP